MGKYLDYNFAYNSYQCVDFLHYLYFVYEPYFSQDLTDYRVSWIEDFHPIHQYKIAEYINNWINGEIKLIGKNSLSDIAKGSIISEMYATIPTQSPHTTSPEAEEINDGEISEIQLSHFEIALLYHYMSVKINHGRDADLIAKKYGKGSGEELMKQVDEIQNSPLRITGNRFSRRYHENIINSGLLDNYSMGKEKALNALKRIKG